MKQDKQELELILKWTKLMQKLPIHCRIYQMKQIIYLIECNIQYNNKHSDCYCDK